MTTAMQVSPLSPGPATPLSLTVGEAAFLSGQAGRSASFAGDWNDIAWRLTAPVNLSAGSFRAIVEVDAPKPVTLRHAFVCEVLPGGMAGREDVVHSRELYRTYQPGLSIVSFELGDITLTHGWPDMSKVSSIYLGGSPGPCRVRSILTYITDTTTSDVATLCPADEKGGSRLDPVWPGSGPDLQVAVMRLEALLRHSTAPLHDMARTIRRLDDGGGAQAPRQDGSHVWHPTWVPSRVPMFFHGNSWAWAEGFKASYYADPSRFRARIDAVAQGLDERSRRHLDWIWTTYVFKLPVGQTSSAVGCLLRRDHVYSPDDLAEQEIVLETFADDTAGVTLPAPAATEVPVFHYHHGLRGLSPTELSSLEGYDALDCGGYVGDTALVLSRYPFRRIVTVEANPDNHARMCGLIRDGGLDRVSALCCGVGETAGFIDFQGEQACTTGHASQTTGAPSSGRSTPIRTIDEIVADLGLEPRFIKMDVEGMESAALRGAVETLRRFRPILSISIYHTPEDLLGIKPFLEDLRLGYSFRIEHHNPFDPVYEMVLMAVPGDGLTA